jgi:hypothetical protein
LAGLAQTHADDAKQTSIPIIVVEPFDGTKAEVPGWENITGQGVSQMLIESLENSDQKFQVLEIPPPAAQHSSSESNSVSGQAKPAATGAAASKKSAGAASKKKPAAAATTAAPETTATNQPVAEAKPAIDETIGSDFTITGALTQFTTETNSAKVGDFFSKLSSISGMGGKVYTAHVEIAWNVVDSVTKKIIKRQISTGSGSGAEFVMSPATAPGAKTTTAKTTAAKTVATAKKTTASATNRPSFFKNFMSQLEAAPSASTTSNTATGAGAKSKSATASAAKPASTSSASSDDAVTDVDSLPVSYANPVFMKSALGKATASAITNFIAQLDALNLPESGRLIASHSIAESLKHTTGKIIAAPNNDTIIVSLGGKQGFKAGDHLEFFRSDIITDSAGHDVFTNETLVGEIILQSVQDESSLGSYSGTEKVQQGWTVKAK